MEWRLIGPAAQEMNSIEATQKQKSQSYNLAKGSLTNLERKRTYV